MADQFTFFNGWDADAVSIQAIHDDGMFTFRIPSGTAYCGFVFGNRTLADPPTLDIPFAFSVSNHKAYVSERGLRKTRVYQETAETTYGIERRNGTINYYINDEIIYTSRKESLGGMHGYAILYSSDSYISDPVIIDSARLNYARALNLRYNVFGVEGDPSWGNIYALLKVEGYFRPDQPVWMRKVVRGADADSGFGRVNLPYYANNILLEFGSGQAQMRFKLRGSEGENYGAVLLRERVTGNDVFVETNGGWIGLPLCVHGEEAAQPINGSVWLMPAVYGTDIAGSVGGVQLRLAVAGTGSIGGNLSFSAPDWQFSIQQAPFAIVEEILELPVLTASATAGASSGVEVILPSLEFSAWGGGTLETAFSSGFSLRITGETETLGVMTATFPEVQLTATGDLSIAGQVSVSLGSFTLSSSALGGITGTIHGWLPTPILIIGNTGSGSGGSGSGDTVLANQMTYAVNVQTGAVTTWALGSVSRLLTAQGQLIGIRDGRLIRFTGITPKALRLRFAQQNFGTLLTKRTPVVYLNVRSPQGLTLSMLADEQTLYRYQLPTSLRQSMETAKVKCGRGVNYHTLGLMIETPVGGTCELGGIETWVESLSRRPR